MWSSKKNWSEKNTVLGIQWNPSIAATLGEQHFGRYTEVVAFIEGLFCTQTVHLGPECLAVISQLAFIQGWPLRGVPLYHISHSMHCTQLVTLQQFLSPALWCSNMATRVCCGFCFNLLLFRASHH